MRNLESFILRLLKWGFYIDLWLALDNISLFLSILLKIIIILIHCCRMIRVLFLFVFFFQCWEEMKGDMATFHSFGYLLLLTKHLKFPHILPIKEYCPLNTKH